MALAIHQGMKVFPSLQAALSEGYQVYDKTEDGFLVRTRTSSGWALALVRMK